jgi:hypothetical protein
MALVFVAMGALSGVSAFDVCGNFCGPTWCAGKVLTECAETDGKSCV